jgi:AraC-like DNA-binding protein
MPEDCHSMRDSKPPVFVPSAKGIITRLAYAFGQEKGVDVETLLRRSGLSHKQIDDPDTRVEVRKQIKFLDLVANATGDDLLGFHLSQNFDPRKVGLLYYVFASSDRLDEALQRAARYSSIVNEGIRLTLRERKEEIGVVFEYRGVARRSDRHQIEFWIAGLLRACRQITSRRLTADRVTFSHRGKVTAELSAFFGSEIKFGAGADEAVFSSSIRDIAIPSGDPYLNELLLRYCEEALSQQKASETSFGLNVENAIALLMPHGKAHISEVARKLGIGQRTLARRLASEGLTFSGVLQGLRCELAKRHLSDDDLSISKIAWLLGYQDVSAFTNAFRRWTGRAPRAIRRHSVSHC